MNEKLTWALSGGVLVALTLTGCGDGGGEERDAWAKKVCDQVEPQARKIQEANAAIAGATEKTQTSKEVKKADAQAFGQIAEAYAALADAIAAAGEPPVDDGAALRKNAVRELNGIATSYRELRKTVDRLDTEDQGKFAEGLKKVAGKLDTLGQSGDQALDKLQSSELGAAMAKQKGCKNANASPTPDRNA